MRVQLQYRCSLINYHSVLFCFQSKLRHFTPLHAHCFFLRTFQQFWDGGLVWAWLLYDDASGEARNRWSLPSPRWGFHACWTSKLCQETQYVASILSGTFVSCALGKWSFTPEVKFHLMLHVHGDERWPMEVTSTVSITLYLFSCSAGDLIKQWGRVPFLTGPQPPPLRATKVCPTYSLPSIATPSTPCWQQTWESWCNFCTLYPHPHKHPTCIPTLPHLVVVLTASTVNWGRTRCHYQTLLPHPHQASHSPHPTSCGATCINSELGKNKVAPSDSPTPLPSSIPTLPHLAVVLTASTVNWGRTRCHYQTLLPHPHQASHSPHPTSCGATCINSELGNNKVPLSDSPTSPPTFPPLKNPFSPLLKQRVMPICQPHPPLPHQTNED